MKTYTLKLRVLLGILLFAFCCVSTVSAVDYPSLSELYGRYILRGECSYTAIKGNSAVPVPAANGYEVAVVPGDSENELRILGFFGYGGGLTLTYDPSTGTLEGETEAVIFCMGNNLPMCVADAGSGKTRSFTYTVGVRNGQVVIAATEALDKVTYMDFSTGDMGTLVYEAGYTMTKQRISRTLTSGTYAFKADADGMDMTSSLIGFEEFDLQIILGSEDVNGGKKVQTRGWFDVEDASVDATYYEDGGVLVMPHEQQLGEGMYFGQRPADEGGYNKNAAPFFFVGADGKLTSPSYFVLDEGLDEKTGNPIQLSFLGAEAKLTATGVAGQKDGDDDRVYVRDGVVCMDAGIGQDVQVYGLTGAVVAERHGASVRIGGLARGLYIVKAGGRATKVLVK